MKAFHYNLPTPSPDLRPEEVVQLQLDALQNNDLIPDDTGIRAAYEFTSPLNRAAIGDVDLFIAMIKNPLYEPMIGFERAELGLVRVRDDVAQLTVRLHNPRTGRAPTYLFTLSRQYDGCWMTDGVLPLQN